MYDSSSVVTFLSDGTTDSSPISDCLIAFVRGTKLELHFLRLNLASNIISFDFRCMSKPSQSLLAPEWKSFLAPEWKSLVELLPCFSGVIVLE